DARFYWREKGKEVDFILRDGGVIPVEVKTTADIGGLAKLVKALRLNRWILLHEGKHGETIKLDEAQVNLMPIFELAFRKDLNPAEEISPV
ncbi:MAG: hypothetical protein QXN56_06695, partial [Candidatus Hadarchaeum sp.]